MNRLPPDQHVTRQLHDVSSPFGWFNIGHRTTYADDDAMTTLTGAALATSFQGLPFFLAVN
jgi:ribulose kinase